MTMRLGYIDFWYVEVLGDHSNYTVADDSEAANRDVNRILPNYDQLLQSSPSSISPAAAKDSEKNSSQTDHLTNVSDSYLSKTLFAPNSLVSFRHLNVPVFPEAFSVSSSQGTPPSQSPPQHSNTQLSHLRLPVKQESVDTDSYLARSLLLPYTNGHGSGLRKWVHNNETTDVEASTHAMDDSLDDQSSALCTDEIDGDIDCDVNEEDLSLEDNEGKVFCGFSSVTACAWHRSYAPLVCSMPVYKTKKRCSCFFRKTCPVLC